MNDQDITPENLLLDHYHCTFFLPLIGLDEEVFKPKGAPFSYYPHKANKVTEEQAQAFCYFSPALRSILFDTTHKRWGLFAEKPDLEPIREWHLPLDQAAPWHLHLGKETERNDPLRYQIARITSVSLYRYFNGIYLLAFRAEPEALVKLREAWGQMDQQDCTLFSSEPPATLSEVDESDPHLENYSQLSMESWLHFTCHARLIYPSFLEQNDEQRVAPVTLIRPGDETVAAFGMIQEVVIPDPPGSEISPIIRCLLKAFASEPKKVDDLLDNYDQLYDDRLFVSVAYGLTHRNLPKDEQYRLFSLASYMDPQEDSWLSNNGYAYTVAASKDRFQPPAMPLPQAYSGWYGCTGSSNTYLGNGSFFRDMIAPNNILWIYDRMLIQALFYQASLRYYDDRICAQTEDLIENKSRANIRNQRDDLIRFTNQYWFHQLTEQMRGKEIFKLQQQALGLSEHYGIIKDKLKRIDEYQQTEHEILIAKSSTQLTRWVLILVLVALIYTLMPVVVELL